MTRSATDLHVASLVRGLDRTLTLADATRLVPHVAAKLPVDTVEAGRVPAGVHLAMTGDATTVTLRVRAGERTSVPAPTVDEVFTVWCGTRLVGHVPLAAEVVVGLPVRDADDIVRIYLPETRTCVVESVVAQGGIVSAPPTARRWVAYGDSITQGWSVTDAGRVWPSVVARDVGLDLVNLAFAGSARGELPAAVQVAESGAELVTLSWGTNCWSSIPTDAAQLAETVRLFLAVVRHGLPEVPIIVISPIVRPGAETEPNRFDATLEGLRAAMEASVTAAASDDPRVTLVRGRDLVQADDLVDGVHPGDVGQAAMAEALLPIIRAATESSLNQ